MSRNLIWATAHITNVRNDNISLLIVFGLNLKEEKTNEKPFVKAYGLPKTNLKMNVNVQIISNMSGLMALMFVAVGYLNWKCS